MIRVPYRRPGFALAREVGAAARARPEAPGLILLNHGLVTWHDDPRQAYRLHVEIVNRAAAYIAAHTDNQSIVEPDGGRAHRHAIAARLAPALRGLLGQDQRVIVRYDDSADSFHFAASPRARLLAEAGAATPDHILHVKRAPMWIAPTADDRPGLAQAARDGLDAYKATYTARFEAHQSGQHMLPPVPRVALGLGVGVFSIGKDSRALDIAADVFHHTMNIVNAAAAVGEYRSLSPSQAFEAEYWPLELYKLSLAPPERELARRVALITGAAGAIGAGIARRFAAAGAHVVAADLNLAGVRSLVDELDAVNPTNRGLAVTMDVTDDASVKDAFQRMVLEFGGIDILVPNAGIALSGAIDALSLDDWQRSFAVNATGQFLVVREGLRIMKEQGTGGSVVFIATKNVPAPGKDFGAYSASKAAQAQLARVVALEGGAFGIRSNMLNPDAVFAGSGLWSPAVRAERARSYGIAESELEEFYRKRNILRVDVTAEDVAEAALFFASDRSAKTTGSMMPVDGGLREAFPR
jgi:rhamnulose-1-phosphate aldolase/alcohol dehydrogenase